MYKYYGKPKTKVSRQVRKVESGTNSDLRQVKFGSIKEAGTESEEDKRNSIKNRLSDKSTLKAD